jgi:hypothetical protein
MFSRYLGQSLGAALFGAIFNTELARRLRDAPGELRGDLPPSVDQVIGALHSGGTTAAVDAWLRDSIASATWHLFAGVAVLATLTLVVLAFVPRHFPVISRDSDQLQGHPGS